MKFESDDQSRFAGPDYKETTHLNRGPRRYEVANQQLYEDVCEILLVHPGVDAREIEVSVAERIVHLRGHVPNRQMKRAAEACLDGIRAIVDVINELEVSHGNAEAMEGLIKNQSRWRDEVPKV